MLGDLAYPWEVLNDLSDILEADDDDIALAAILLDTARERMGELAALRARLAEAEAREQAPRETIEQIRDSAKAMLAFLPDRAIDPTFLALCAGCSHEKRDHILGILAVPSEYGCVACQCREFVAAAQPATAEEGAPVPHRRVWMDDAGPRDDGIEGPEDGCYVS